MSQRTTTIKNNNINRIVPATPARNCALISTWSGTGARKVLPRRRTTTEVMTPRYDRRH
jgi:hypothetical protein